MLTAERAGSISTGIITADSSNNSNNPFDIEKQKLKKTMGVDLAIRISSSMNKGTFQTLSDKPAELVDRIALLSFRSLDVYMKPNQEANLLVELLTSTLAKNWNTTNTQNIDETEKGIALECKELRDKGYDLKKVLQEVSVHFHFPLNQLTEIAIRQYFTIDDVAEDLEMNRGSVKNKVAKILKERPSIVTEHFGGLNQTYISKNHWEEIKSAIESSKQKVIFTLPDDQQITINGRIQKKIMEKLLENVDEGFSLEDLLTLYPEDNRDQARVKAHHVIEYLRKELQELQWDIENEYISKGPGKEHISNYFLRKHQATKISPATPVEEVKAYQEPKKEPVVVFEAPKGEKPFYSLADIAKGLAKDLGRSVKESEVRKALGRMEINDPGGRSSEGGKKEGMKLSYAQYQVKKGPLQEEFKEKKKPKRKATSSGVPEYLRDVIRS